MIRKILLLLVGATASVALAQDPPSHTLSPEERFVAVDLGVREITLDGMRQRLALLRTSGLEGNDRTDADANLDTETQRRINAFYRASGTTAAAHAAFGTRHAESVRELLATHPEWRARHEALESEFQSLSAQLRATR